MIYDFIVTGSSGLLGTTLVRDLESSGKSVLGTDLETGLDLTDEDSVKYFFRNYKARNLVNLFARNDKVTSGGFNASFLDLELQEFRQTLEINLTALFSVCREFIRNNDFGSIVNFSSIYGVKSPDPKIYPSGEKPVSYGVSKAGVLQLSRHLAVHSAPSFRINTIILGGIFENQNSEFIAKYSNKVPLGRMGKPAEILSAVEFLTSEASSYVTGASLAIDGGLTAW